MAWQEESEKAKEKALRQTPVCDVCRNPYDYFDKVVYGSWDSPEDI